MIGYGASRSSVGNTSERVSMSFVEPSVSTARSVQLMGSRRVTSLPVTNEYDATEALEARTMRSVDEWEALKFSSCHLNRLLGVVSNCSGPWLLFGLAPPGLVIDWIAMGWPS